ncbi:fatty acid desaturase family protein [Ohtaekwangia kribbensis]|uniref:Fatty acid desaturase family protein n=1 Tax=Ohtaekwangia kribbensis TaxID=688913 RepID=A0ABW3K4I3_9BACT
MKPVSSIALGDPVFSSSPTYTSIDRYWLRKIKDERDLPFVYLTLRITLIMLPVAVLLYMPFVTGWLWWSLAVLYFILNNFVFKGPFGLMLHCTSHRPFFNQQYAWLNSYLPWIISPFFGQTPETYASHHLAMHHRENNLEEDLSSTMHYQRDSFRHFLLYFSRFFFTVIPTLAWYFNERSQLKLRNRVIRGELAFFGMCALLCIISWQATVMVFLLPLLISRIIMMVGNWAQHSFIEESDPGNFYKNSITCINTPYNHKCWNDGYHISHHIQPAMHWTLHPEHLQTNLQVYATNKALIFEGIHFLHVWWYLMNKDYKKLAKRVVNIHGMFASEEDIISLMKSRTREIKKRQV